MNEQRDGSSGAGAQCRRIECGVLPNGATVEGVELTNGSGISVRVMALGAALQALSVPDRRGASADIVLGHATPSEYLAHPQFFGASVGRYANRIARGAFSLDGRRYQLETNNGVNHLHGGVQGFDKALWTIASSASGPPARVVLEHFSPDGDAGYPGALHVSAAYSLSEHNELTIEYRARTDRTTIVNVTNHSYYNLAGEGGDVDILGHQLTLFADAYTPIDATLIPTGELRSVASTPFDFREAHAIGAQIRDGDDPQLLIGQGYDHNFVVNGRAGELRPAARLEHPDSGRVLELAVTAPGLQFYSGNLLDGRSVGKSGRIYRQSAGLCLEPQLFPDSPNRFDFPSARLDPGVEYANTMVLRFLTN